MLRIETGKVSSADAVLRVSKIYSGDHKSNQLYRSDMCRHKLSVELQLGPHLFFRSNSQVNRYTIISSLEMEQRQRQYV